MQTDVWIAAFAREVCRMRRFILILAVFLPQTLKQAVYRRVLAWTIGKHVSIGFSLLDARETVLEDGVHIGHLNIFRRLRYLHLGRGVIVLHSNEVVGAAVGYEQTSSSFTMEAQSSMNGTPLY